MLDSILELISSSPWTYLVVFAIAALDAVLPIVPAETAVITAGALAAGGQLEIAGIIICATAGAAAGDNLSYILGRTAGEPVRRRFFGGAKAAARLAWAQRQLIQRGGSLLIVARFIPGGRTATTLTAGLVHMSWRRFIAFDLIAVIIWANYSALLGYIGGQAFEDQPLTGVLVALGAAVALTGLYELIRHHRQRGRRPADNDAIGVRPQTSRNKT